MDTVKGGHIKVKTGDCVSIPSEYFGAAFEQHLRNAGIQDNSIYGCVLEVLDRNRTLTSKSQTL